MMGIKKRVFAVVLSAIMLLSVAGVGTASAVTKNVGGGKWEYSSSHMWEPNQPLQTISNSKYYHKTKRHGASVKVGKSGKVYRKCEPAGRLAQVSSTGIGTAYAYWHSTCNH